MALALALAMLTGRVQADIRIDADNLAQLPTGVSAHQSVRAVSGADGSAWLLSAGGFSAPTAGNLKAASGSISLRCRTPEHWPPADDRALFHIGEKAHVHVTLLFRGSLLMAVYKGGKEHFALVRSSEAEIWRPESWHEVQFSWCRASSETVDFLLTIDGRLVGLAVGKLIEDWPATCFVGVRGARTPWQGMLDDIVLSVKPIVPPELAPGRRTIAVRGDDDIGACYRFWTIGNHNKPHAFADAAYSRRVTASRPFVTQINAVYLLGGRYRDQNCWFQGVGEDGRVLADFTGMLTQLQAIVDGGLVPWIVLDNIPYTMSAPPQENTYGNTAPPADERLWSAYVEQAIRAMVGHFGRDLVSTWWFRVGTEPDLCPAHWAGTREQYFTHYDYTVDAVTRVLPQATVGPGNILNPAGGEFGTTTRKQWGLDIIDHVAQGTNACTGTQGTRMDWFSFSWYARVGQPLTRFDAAVTAIRSRMARYPELAETPLVVGEFAVLHDERGRRIWSGETTEWAASFYAALADRVYRYGIRHVYEWAQTTGGLLHPRTNVMSLLQTMSGGRRLAVDVQGESMACCGAIASRQGEDLLVLLYNHRFLRRPKVDESVQLVLRDSRMRAGDQWLLSEQLVDAEHGTWAHAFAADCAAAGLTQLPKAGSFEGDPRRLYGDDALKVFHSNRATYAALAQIPVTRDAEPLRVLDGNVQLDLQLNGHSVRLLRLAPPAQ